MSLAATATASLRTDCHECAAAPGQPCTVAPGVHYRRVARARAMGWIDEAQFAEAIHTAVVFTAASVLNPETAV